MNRVAVDDVRAAEVGMWAEYNGDSRWGNPFLAGVEYKIANVRRNVAGEAIAVGLDVDSEIYWTSVNSIVNLSREDFDIDKVFTDAAGGPVAVLTAELERKRLEVAELEAALATLKKYTN
jgi:hypothetical protein